MTKRLYRSKTDKKFQAYAAAWQTILRLTPLLCGCFGYWEH